MEYFKDIRYRVLQRLLYFVLVAAIFSFISNIVNKRSLGIVLIPVIVLLVSVFLLVLIRIKPYYGKIAALVIFNFVILPIIWVFSPGIASASTSYAVIVIIFSTLMVEKRWEFSFPLLSIILSLAMIGYEYFNPDFFTPYPSKAIQVNDVAMNFGIIVIMGSVFIAYFNRAYQKEKDMIYSMSITDELTETYNRRYFYNYGENVLMQYKRYDRTFSVAMIDLDNFKEINDEYGHLLGDIVLKAFVDNVKDHLRETDAFARIGGDEFGLILHEVDGKTTHEILERIRKSLENMEVSTPKGIIKITCSIGASQVDESYDHFEGLVKSSDEKLYRAKEEGRNRVIM